MSFRNLGLACLVLLVSASGLMADTIPGGDVSGTWYQSHSPYYIAGDIAIRSSDTLTIEPGVEVNFLGAYGFAVQGLLLASGTAADSIRFTAGQQWVGLWIMRAPDSSRLEYCVLEAHDNYQGTVYCASSNPVISHCRISNNRSLNPGSGGITLDSSNARISHCTIAGNSANTNGGGIMCRRSAPRISHCEITGNIAGNRGGGISVETFSNPMVDSCVIRSNRARDGGGIALADTAGGTTISGCTISADSAWTGNGQGQGGGIYVNSPGASVTITRSDIDACAADNAGAGIFIQSAAAVSLERSVIDGNICSGFGGFAIYSHACSNLLIDHCDVVKNEMVNLNKGIKLDTFSTLTFTNSIFRGQGGYGIVFNTDSSVQVSYSDFYDSTGSRFGGKLPPGLGELVQTNYNGDSCDVYYNTFLDPMFADYPNSDYNLTDSSPCIDAGDPNSPWDPDSTLPDMGAFFFFQTGQAEPTHPQVTAGRPGPTIIHSVLNLQSATCDLQSEIVLLDAIGRKVLDLSPGPNGVSRLPPGIYFLHSAIDTRHSSITKVVIAR